MKKLMWLMVATFLLLGFIFLCHEKSRQRQLNQSGMTAHIKTQDDLEAYLKQTGRDWTGDQVYFENKVQLTFPSEKIYVLSEPAYWYFSSSATESIDFNNSQVWIGNQAYLTWDFAGSHQTKLGKNSQLSNLTVIGSMSETTNQETGEVSQPFPWRGHFHARFLHASHLTFSNMIFRNAHKSDDHIFDIAGSDHIYFNEISVEGYGGEALTPKDIEARYKNEPHSLYAEAIQIDSAIDSAFGGLDLTKTELWRADRYDKTPSSYISITSSKFLPYSGPSGQQLINSGGKTDKRVNRPYGATIGAHTIGKSDYHHLTMTENEFRQTIFSPIDDNRIYPIHLLKDAKNPGSLRDNHILIEDNIFKTQNTYTRKTSDLIDGIKWYVWYQ